MMKIQTLMTGFLVSLVVVSYSSKQVTRAQLSAPPKNNSPSTLHTRIDEILNDTLLSQCFVGMKIVSLENDSVLYEKNSIHLFHPASNMKLLTTATALHVLDKDFRFTTKIFTDTAIDKGTLDGNLYVKGVGDPLLTTNDLDSLAKLVHRFGIQSIEGDLIGDVSYFDSTHWGAGWMWDDEPDPDEAFLSPLTVNSNSIRIVVQPGRSRHKPLESILEPNTNYVHVNNFGVTSSDTSFPQLSVTRQRGENAIDIRGRLSPTDAPRTFMFSVRQPEMYFLNLFKERLMMSGIDVKGSVRIDTVRSTLKLTELSHSIDSVLYRTNKESDNIAAENLLKTMASEKVEIPGSASNGLLMIKRYLSSIGIDTSKILLADGSGVSWYNAVSPNDIVQLLKKEFENKTTFHRFFTSLPIAGIDGTLKNQMKGTATMGNVHAKTGTLTGVSSLSGYVTTADQKLVAFSILSNHFPGKVSALREMQNNIMEVLASCNISW